MRFQIKNEQFINLHMCLFIIKRLFFYKITYSFVYSQHVTKFLTFKYILPCTLYQGNIFFWKATILLGKWYKAHYVWNIGFICLSVMLNSIRKQVFPWNQRENGLKSPHWHMTKLSKIWIHNHFIYSYKTRIKRSKYYDGRNTIRYIMGRWFLSKN